MMQNYTEKAIKSYLPNTPLTFLETAGSTNTLAKQSAAKGAPHGALFVAKAQTAGQGRMQRAFTSPLGGIYLSVVLRPQSGEVFAPGLITAGAAVAVHNAVQKLCGVTLSIKWVNDLLWQNKKCCGILTEAGWQGNSLAYYIVGIGLNYTGENDAFSANSPLAGIATALYKSGQQPVPHAQLLAEIYNNLLAIFSQLPNADFMQTYRQNSNLLGKDITVLATPPYTAKAVQIDDTAQLHIALPNGEVKVLNSGEVSVRL